MSADGEPGADAADAAPDGEVADAAQGPAQGPAPLTEEAEQVLREMLQLERAAAAFYADLLERVEATPELRRWADSIRDMAEEEAEHAEMVEELLERRGIKVVVSTE